jgi:DcuC family C4-dicarboxylate transporter
MRHTGCDRHLVQLLVKPLRRGKLFLIPGVVLVGFLVNVPVISQTSTAVCIGAVVVPLMRAAHLSPVTVGASILLGLRRPGLLLVPRRSPPAVWRLPTDAASRVLFPSISGVP